MKKLYGYLIHIFTHAWKLNCEINSQAYFECNECDRTTVKKIK